MRLKVTIVTALLLAGCSNGEQDMASPYLEVRPLDLVSYVDLAREAVERDIAGRDFDRWFVSRSQLTEPTTAVRNAPTDYPGSYRAVELLSTEADSLVASGYELCLAEYGSVCRAWQAEATALLLAVGIPERRDEGVFRLPFTWAVRVDGWFRHDGGAYVDVVWSEETSGWERIGFRRLWMDH